MKSSICLLAFILASGVSAVSAEAPSPVAVSPANELCDSWKTLYPESLPTAGWSSTFPGTQYAGSSSVPVDVWTPERLVIIWGEAELPGFLDPLNPQAVCSTMSEIYSERPAVLLERLKLLSKEFGTADIARKTPLSAEEVTAFQQAILADFYRQKKSEDLASETPSRIDFSGSDYFPNTFTGVTQEYANERMRVRCREGALSGTVSKKQREREDSKGVVSAVAMDHGYVANCAAVEGVLMLFPPG